MSKRKAPKNPKPCKIDGCENHSRARGLCVKHYNHVKHNEGFPEQKQCNVNDCQRPATRRGMCKMHYDRFRNHGEVIRTQFDANKITINGEVAHIGLYDRNGVKTAIFMIDAEDVEKIGGVKWGLTSRGYVVGKKDDKHTKLSRLLLMPIKDGLVVDHKNGDKLDNRKCNLRATTQALNAVNTQNLQSVNTSGYQGVSWNKELQRWIVSVTCNKISHYLGTYTNKEEAATAYDKKAKELFGEFAFLNFPNGGNDYDNRERTACC